jgi:hypothetical protein
MLQEVDHGMDILAQEEQSIARIQDPSEIRGQRGRIFGKGGQCIMKASSPFAAISNVRKLKPILRRILRAHQE